MCTIDLILSFLASRNSPNNNSWKAGGFEKPMSSLLATDFMTNNNPWI